MADEKKEQVPEKVTHLIRIEGVPKRSKRQFLIPSSQKYIQGVPFELSLRVTNIGKAPTSGFTLSHVAFKSTTENLKDYSHNDIYVRPLNPGESVIVCVDRFTTRFKGLAWIGATIKTDTTNDFKTHQYDENHKKDEPFRHLNSWDDAIYVQGEMEVLQGRTNFLILVLTIITVLDSTIGILDLLKEIRAGVSSVLSWLAVAIAGIGT